MTDLYAKHNTGNLLFYKYIFKEIKLGKYHIKVQRLSKVATLLRERLPSMSEPSSEMESCHILVRCQLSPNGGEKRRDSIRKAKVYKNISKTLEFPNPHDREPIKHPTVGYVSPKKEFRPYNTLNLSGSINISI